MSSTRRAAPGKPLRQERWSSSPEFDRGILANLTAQRCELLDCVEDRQSIWFIQYMSHVLGLKNLAVELKARFGDMIGTPTMRKLAAVKKYDAAQVRMVREELPIGQREAFLLKGEVTLLEVISKSERSRATPEIERALEGYESESNQRPDSYPASDFRALCERYCDSQFESDLVSLCNDPKADTKGPWYFTELGQCIREMRAAQIEGSRKGKITTEVGRMIDEVLNYTLAAKCLSLTNGRSRIGKSVAVKAWCDAHPHVARYVEVISTNDDIGFFKAIAKSLGLSRAGSWKAADLRQKTEEVLQTGDLIIVFDEAHYLWPNKDYCSEP